MSTVKSDEPKLYSCNKFKFHYYQNAKKNLPKGTSYIEKNGV